MLRCGAAVLMLLASVLAGCVADDDADAGADTNVGGSSLHGTWSTTPVDAFLARSVLVDDDSSRGEPPLAVSAEGTLFTTTETSFLRSYDEGATWEELARPTRPNTGDPDIVVGPEGKVWYSEMIGSFAWMTVSTSTDDGESWTRSPLANDVIGGDRQYVIPLDADRAVMAYHRLPEFHPVVIRTEDGGLTWSSVYQEVYANVAPERSLWFGTGFRNEATGTLWFPETWYSEHNGDTSCVTQDCYGQRHVSALVSRDEGATWTRIMGPAFQSAYYDMGLIRGAVDEAGNVYLAWADVTDGNMGIWMTVTRDDGQTFSDPQRVDDGSGAKVFPSVAAGAPGRVAVSYYEADTDGGPDDLPDAATWTTTLTWWEDALGAPAERTHAQISQDVVKHGAICTRGTLCQGDREFRDYLALQAMPDGRVAGIHNVLPEGGDGALDLENWFTLTADALLRGS